MSVMVAGTPPVPMLQVPARVVTGRSERCDAVTRRRGRLQRCPRCNQWRTRSQLDAVLGLCEPCVERVLAAAPFPGPARTHLQDTSVEDVEWLAGWDTEEAIAHRLGCASPATLHRRLYRAGRPDLVAALTEPRRRFAS